MNDSGDMPSVLVTGGNGFTGTHLAAQLRKADYSVSTLSNIKTGADSHYQCDLRDRPALDDIISRIDPDYVVHLSAISFVAGSDLLSFYDVNVLGTCNLLESIARLDPDRARKVILASSANIYGNTSHGKPIPESQCPAPVNHYSASKLAMEHLAQTWAERLPIVITRPFNYTGPGQTNKFLVPKIVEHCVKREPSIKLGNIDVSRDFLGVDDVVNAYMAIIQNPIDCQTYNVCSGTSVSLKQILEWAQEITGHELQVETDPGFVRKNEIMELVGDNNRLVEATGWQPSGDFRSVLVKMVEDAAK